MDSIREDIVFAAYHRACALIDYNIQDTTDKQFDFLRRTVLADKIVEWIPYNKLQNIKYLTKGGCSEIYGAYWIDGRYYEWDSKEKQLKRCGGHNVVLKKLENVESANRSWFDESKFHLSISNKHADIVKCYGLTKNPLDENYMLVLFKLRNNLREYLQQNHNKLTWEKRIQIINDIVLNYQNESNRHKRDKSIIKKLLGKIGLSKSGTNIISKTNEINIFETYSDSTSRLFTSKLYQFKNPPEPKNATEAFYSKSYSFNIPYNIEDFDNKSNNNTSKSSDILKDDSKKLSKIFENVQINSNNDNQNNYKEETIQQVKKHNIDDIDDDEMYDTSNFHSEEQDEFEIPNDGF
ncbi:kinase-like domain-containing protein [Rhizophagus clarus]|uniref:Kinase-like domain-containing protein n=1 Tax=Rhizophagus clarus TaxID=94130 RepID=A0A8H3QGR3_9GLOM|nr:kinase-like domain-containing protein [Rhizophagus clarus]